MAKKIFHQPTLVHNATLKKTHGIGNWRISNANVASPQLQRLSLGEINRALWRKIDKEEQAQNKSGNLANRNKASNATKIQGKCLAVTQGLGVSALTASVGTSWFVLSFRKTNFRTWRIPSSGKHIPCRLPQSYLLIHDQLSNRLIFWPLIGCKVSFSKQASKSACRAVLGCFFGHFMDRIRYSVREGSCCRLNFSVSNYALRGRV